MVFSPGEFPPPALRCAAGTATPYAHRGSGASSKPGRPLCEHARHRAPANRAPAQTAGELYICGWEKELIILRGANHAPHEFEEALTASPGFAPGALWPWVSSGGGDRRGARVTRRDRGLVPSELVDLIRGRVAQRTGYGPRPWMLAPGLFHAPRAASCAGRRRCGCGARAP